MPKILSRLFRLVMSIAVLLYRITGGKFGGKVQGLRVLLLTTTGRKTGKKRTTPLGYFEHDGGGYVIIGSNAGFDTHPAWFHNLSADPNVAIQIREDQFLATAEIAGPEQRDQLWQRLMELAPPYANYAKRTSRQIPLVILRRIKA